MTIATMSKREVIASRRRQEHFAQTTSGAIAAEQQAKTSHPERHGHEEWKRRIEQDWQNHLGALQRCICAILHAKQQPKTSLMSAIKRERGYGNAINL